MKKLLIPILLFLSGYAFSQPVVNRSSNVVTVQDGNLFAGRSFRVPAFNDTTSQALVPTLDSCGKIIFTYADNCLWYRECFPTKNWKKIASSSTGLFVDSIYSSPATKTDTLIYIKSNDTTHVQITDRNCGLIDPGVVTYDSLLIFDISPSIYRLCSDGIRRTSGQTKDTLDAADGTFDRFDAIILDANGVNTITGTPSANPVQPQITPDQILLTYILVPTGATTIPSCTAAPDITVYDENTEWTTTATATVNFNDATQPYHLIKDVDVTSFAAGQTMTFTPLTPITLQNYTYLKFAIRLKGVLNPNRALFISWVTSAGNVTMQVKSGTHGFDREIVGSYQIITVGIPEWVAPSAAIAAKLATANTISLQFSFGGNEPVGFYVDYIQLGGGCIVQPVTTSHDNSFGIVTTASGSAVATKPTDILTVVGTGGTNVSVSGKTLTINSTAGISAITADNGATASTISNIQFGSSSSTGSPLLHHTFLYGASTYTLDLNNLRFEPDYGASVTAANDLTLGLDGNTFPISGATQINAITTSNWQAGSVVYLKFASTPTVKNNTAGGAGTAVILLAGGIDFIAGAGDVLTLVYDGTSWNETARKVTATGGTNVYTASNGLTMTANNNVLGGTLSGNTTINPNSFYLVFNGTKGQTYIDDASLSVNSIYGSTTPFVITWTPSAASGTSADIGGNFTSTNTVVNTMQVNRQTSGTAANGIGNSIMYKIETTAGTSNQTNELISKWTDATHATRTSQFIITGVNSATTADLFTLSGSGATKLNKYGIGTFTGTPAYTLQVDASGNIIEGSASGASVPINTLLAATGTNTINNANYAQVWQWNTLAGTSALSLTSNSTAAASSTQKLLNISLSGANATSSQTTYGAYITNSHGGTSSANVGLEVDVYNGTSNNQGIIVYTEDAGYGIFARNAGSGAGTTIYAQNDGSSDGIAFYAAADKTGATTGIAGKFSATNATNNYAIIVPASSGRVGIGNSAPNSLLQVSGSVSMNYVAKTGTYTLDVTDYTVDCTSGTFTVNLPTAVGITGRIYVIKNSGAGTITIDGSGSETIDGATTQTLSVQYSSYTIQSNGSNWIIL